MNEETFDPATSFTLSPAPEFPGVRLADIQPLTVQRIRDVFNNLYADQPRRLTIQTGEAGRIAVNDAIRASYSSVATNDITGWAVTTPAQATVWEYVRAQGSIQEEAEFARMEAIFEQHRSKKAERRLTEDNIEETINWIMDGEADRL